MPYGVGCRVLAERDEHDVPQLMRYLRDHFEAGTVNAADRGQGPPVCVHPKTTDSSAGATAASMVAELTPGELPPVAWVSMAAPCTGVFIPVTVGQRLPTVLENGDERPSRDSAWWAMRELQYVIDPDPVMLTPLAQAVWGSMEHKLLTRDPRLTDEAPSRLTASIMERRDRLILELTVTQLESDYSIVVLE